MLFSCYIVDLEYYFKSTVNCQWGVWGEYSKCSKTCGGGKQSRTRSKTVVESNGGICSDLPTETITCNTQKCPSKLFS